MLAASILGTKAILLFIFCYLIYLLVFHARLSLVKIAALGIVILMVMGVFVYLTGIYSFFIERSENQGVLYAITSKRSTYIGQNVIPLLNDFKFWNYFIGGNYFKIPLTEMDLIDAFLFLGLIGVCIYILLLKRTLFAFTLENKTGLFFVSQYILIGALAGHLFTSGINAIYVALLVNYIQRDNEKLQAR